MHRRGFEQISWKKHCIFITSCWKVSLYVQCQGKVQWSFIVLLILSIGTCQHYLRGSNLCNIFYKSTDYIFTNMNQSLIPNELDERIFHVLSGGDGECGDLISRVLCHYFFAPCGANGQLHLPLSLCPDECHYVQSVCPVQDQQSVKHFCKPKYYQVH